MTLLMKKRVLAVKKEITTLGLGIEPLVGDAYIPAFDINIAPQIEMVERQSPGTFSSFASVVGPRSGVATFKTHFYGGGATNTAPLWAELLFPACGFAQAAEVFSPSSLAPVVGSATANCNVTISSYEDGLQKSIVGAMGTFKMTFTAGKTVVIEWTFTGLWEGPAGAAPVVAKTILAPTYDTTIPMRFASTVLSLGSGPTCIESMTLDAGNDVVLRPCATDVTGYANAVITGRKTVGSFNPESALLGTEDVHALWLAGTEEAFSCKITDSTQMCTITAPKVQRTNIQPGDRNGIQVDNIDFQCNKSAALGDDELIFTFAAEA